ncbi:hypothetical protein [Sulfurimonas sp. HSL3-7]|uniref:hypothetical protein n=1 Tax=Sulfonitrofixus jiaomeiensis TaxID=3131938 RepID=UPI0031F809BC
MKILFLLFIFLTTLHAETLVDRLKEGNISGVKESIKDTRMPETKEQERLRILTDQPKPVVEGVAIELFKTEIDKNTSIGVEYAPELKQGELIDNKEQTTIKLEHKF